MTELDDEGENVVKETTNLKGEDKVKSKMDGAEAIFEYTPPRNSCFSWTWQAKIQFFFTEKNRGNLGKEKEKTETVFISWKWNDPWSDSSSFSCLKSET